MITYSMWKGLTDFDYFDKNLTRIACYSFAIFCSLFSIPLDILTSPFQIMGLIIFLITKIIKK